MAKIVSENHIRGEEGVNAFATYCNRHKPYIIWREETKNDFGIDGEVELTRVNSNGKTEASGEIIKIQLKSTEGGYITKETDESFDFIAKKDDIEYWTKHNCQVIVVVYFPKTKQLFAKKIEKDNFITTNKTSPIKFSKITNLLEGNESDFTAKYSQHFKERINFDTKEELMSNMFKVTFPKYIFVYQTKLRAYSELKDKIDNKECPCYILKEKKIYLFNKLDIFNNFQDLVLVESSRVVEQIIVKEFLKEDNNRKIFIELMNKVFSNFFHSRYIGYNKEFSRYYFKLSKAEEERTESYIGQRKKATRTVVKFYEYGKKSFYRHSAFDISFLFSDMELFVVINPKYLLTQDKYNVIDNPKDITKFTNYLTSKDQNEGYGNHIHFIFDFFAKGAGKIVVNNYENEIISISKNLYFNVPFGIPIDSNRKTIIKQEPTPTLF